MKASLYAFVCTLLSVSLISCSNENQPSELYNLFAPKPANLRVNLTDAPTDEVAQVNVNIDRIELLLQKGGKEGRLILGQDTGVVDLLTLQNGKLLGLADVEIPDGITVTQIRLVLKNSDNFLVMNNGDICQLQTPSQQITGIKVILGSPVTFESGNAYSMVVDFDAKKSIVLQGNGGCLLKPTLKLKSFTSLPEDEVADDGSTEEPGEDLADGTDSNDDGTNDGFDPTDPSTWPPDLTEDELQSYF